MSENTSTHKTKIDQIEVVNFLNKFYLEPLTNLETISGGEGSQAFSYDSDSQSYVIRINKHSDKGFQKDKYAHDNFPSANLPIPEVVAIGQLENGHFYCITKKAVGKTLDKSTKEENIKILPKIFKMLDEIHSQNISKTFGYGNWKIDTTGDNKTWVEFLFAVDRWAKELFEKSFLERDVWDKIYAKFIILIPFCPEERYLIHADVGFDNLIADQGKITGVIDWENSKYGDFVFDISWLCFWSTDPERDKIIKEHYKNVPNFKERLLCYQLYIGLGSLSFYAYSNQKNKYESSKDKLLELIK